MRVVYVAGSFTAPTAWAIEQNVRRAEEVGLYVAQCGAMPIIPHANTRFFTGLCTPEFWYDGTMELLRRADAVMLVPGWEHSKGARLEVLEASNLMRPVFFFQKPESKEAFAKWAKGEDTKAQLLCVCGRRFWPFGPGGSLRCSACQAEKDA